MQKNLKIYLFALVIAACQPGNQDQDENLLAEVNGKYLYANEVLASIPQGKIEESDSAGYFDAYIEDWIKLQLLIAEAEKALSDQELKIEEEIERYRQDLLIHRYNGLRIQHLTRRSVPYSEVESYYEKNKRSFLLKEPIVQVEYTIFPIETKIPRSFKRKINSEKEEDILEKEDFIFKYAKRYDNFNKSWIYFSSILNRSVPIEDPEKFLQDESLIEYETNDEIHLIAIKDHKAAGEVAPIDFVAPKIENLLINNKKLDYLREIKDSLYNSGLKYNKFRVYK